MSVTAEPSRYVHWAVTAESSRTVGQHGTATMKYGWSQRKPAAMYHERSRRDPAAMYPRRSRSQSRCNMGGYGGGLSKCIMGGCDVSWAVTDRIYLGGGAWRGTAAMYHGRPQCFVGGYGGNLHWAVVVGHVRNVAWPVTAVLDRPDVSWAVTVCSSGDSRGYRCDYRLVLRVLNWKYTDYS